MLVRRAIDTDAVQACKVMRRSIAELCERDHHGDPAILRGWLGNKTPVIVAGWIAAPENVVLVAVEGDVVMAVGAVTKYGEITLNYVSPDARFRGVSRAMLAALEAAAREFGNCYCNLTSTETAHRFYRSAGYEDVGMPQGQFGTTSSYPMLKRLGDARSSAPA